METAQKSTFKTFLSYLIPSMLGMALMAIYTFTDTFVVGRALGSVALGAMGICTPIITISYALGFLFGMGGGALYSIETGKKNVKQANILFSTSMFMALVLGIILAVFLNLFAEPFARFLGADEENLIYVLPYLRCVVTYIPGFMLDVFLMSYMKNDGHPNVAMTGVVLGTVLNIVLDLLFVFVFHWGMFGAAIATCIGSLIGISINGSYALRKKLNICFHPGHVHADVMGRILKAGISVFILESSSGIVTFVFINRAVYLYGTIGSSVYTIIMNWTLICFNLIMGIAQSVQPLISVSFGAGDQKRVRTYRNYALFSAGVAGLLFLILGYSMTSTLVGVFAKDSDELIQLAANSFKLYLPAYFFMGFGICIGIYFQSIEAAMRSLLIMSLRGIILPVLGAVGLTAVLKGSGLWITVPLAEFITGILAVVLLLRYEKASAASIEQTELSAVHQSASTPGMVIAISREFGSGGHEIGRLVGEKLGIPVYDKELGAMTQVISGFDSDFIDTMEDRHHGVSFYLYSQHQSGTLQSQIFREQSKILTDLAAKGSCVVVGRCADYVLRGQMPMLSVFVHAPLEVRAKRVMEFDHCSEDEAVRRIRESDKARKGYHDYFTDIRWGEAQSYDLTVSSACGIDKAADLIVELARQ